MAGRPGWEYYVGGNLKKIIGPIIATLAATGSLAGCSSGAGLVASSLATASSVGLIASPSATAQQQTDIGYYDPSTLASSVEAWLDKRLSDPSNSIWTKPLAIKFVPGVTITSLSCLRNLTTSTFTCRSVASDPTLSRIYSIKISGNGKSWATTSFSFLNTDILANAIKLGLRSNASVSCAPYSSGIDEFLCTIADSGNSVTTEKIQVTATGGEYYQSNPALTEACTLVEQDISGEYEPLTGVWTNSLTSAVNYVRGTPYASDFSIFANALLAYENNENDSTVQALDTAYAPIQKDCQTVDISLGTS